MKDYDFVYKKVSETPFEAIERYRTDEGIDISIPLSYIGRLDPMAEGTILVLIDHENKNREKYLGLDKEYEFSILLGVLTDSGDILGKISKTKFKEYPGINDLKQVLKKHEGKSMQKISAFSSKKINGVSMFDLAKQGSLKESDIPEKKVELNILEIGEIIKKSSPSVYKDIINRISNLRGDFRQDEIMSQWRNVVLPSKLLTISIKIKVSSGFYIRQLVADMSKDLNFPMCVYTIMRTKYFV